MNGKLAVVVPSYNEAQTLPLLLEGLFSLPLPDLGVLLVDDNSPDGTGQIAERLRAEFYQGRLEVIHRPGRLGVGSAYIQGFRRALEREAELVVQMDSDLSHEPAVIPRFVEAIQDCDCVIGSRYVPGGGLDHTWGIHRRLLSGWANLYAKAILGLPMRDVTGGFRCYRNTALEIMHYWEMRSQGFIFQVESSYRLHRLGLEVREVPITFRQRLGGRSKMSLPILAEAAWRVWQFRFSRMGTR